MQLAQRQGNGIPEDPFYLDTVGISEEERSRLRQRLTEAAEGGVDPVVSSLVAATNGIAYKHLIGRLKEYPIPELRLPPGEGKVLLDVGCNWGRWCIAAARLGYRAIGIDPSLGAVLAAKRASAQLGLEAQFVVGDARFLPFRNRSIDVAYSYSVLQHFARADAVRAFHEIGRILQPGGKSVLQMPTILGARCVYHQARRRFREPAGFDVRYWSVPRLRRLLTDNIGITSFSVDCFFGIGLQAADLRFMPPSHKLAIWASELLRKASRILPWISYLADSVYAESIKSKLMPESCS